MRVTAIALLALAVTAAVAGAGAVDVKHGDVVITDTGSRSIIVRSGTNGKLKTAMKLPSKEKIGEISQSAVGNDALVFTVAVKGSGRTAETYIVFTALNNPGESIPRVYRVPGLTAGGKRCRGAVSGSSKGALIATAGETPMTFVQKLWLSVECYSDKSTCSSPDSEEVVALDYVLSEARLQATEERYVTYRDACSADGGKGYTINELRAVQEPHHRQPVLYAVTTTFSDNTIRLDRLSGGKRTKVFSAQSPSAGAEFESCNEFAIGGAGAFYATCIAGTTASSTVDPGYAVVEFTPKAQPRVLDGGYHRFGPGVNAFVPLLSTASAAAGKPLYFYDRGQHGLALVRAIKKNAPSKHGRTAFKAGRSVADLDVVP